MGFSNSASLHLISTSSSEASNTQKIVNLENSPFLLSLSVSLSLSLSLSLCVCVCVCVCLSVWLSVCMSVCLSLCLSVCVSLSTSSFLFLSLWNMIESHLFCSEHLSTTSCLLQNTQISISLQNYCFRSVQFFKLSIFYESEQEFKYWFHSVEQIKFLKIW